MAHVFWRGKDLAKIPLTERDLRFSDLFPGETKRFYSENGEELVIRVVNSATRRLHPSSDCLKGAGFNVTPQPGNQMPELGNSSCLLATKPGTAEILSCEQIRDLSGQQLE